MYLNPLTKKTVGFAVTLPATKNWSTNLKFWKSVANITHEPPSGSGPFVPVEEDEECEAVEETAVEDTAAVDEGDVDENATAVEEEEEAADEEVPGLPAVLLLLATALEEGDADDEKEEEEEEEDEDCAVTNVNCIQGTAVIGGRKGSGHA